MARWNADLIRLYSMDVFTFHFQSKPKWMKRENIEWRIVRETKRKLQNHWLYLYIKMRTHFFLFGMKCKDQPKKKWLSIRKTCSILHIVPSSMWKCSMMVTNSNRNSMISTHIINALRIGNRWNHFSERKWTSFAIFTHVFVYS